MTVLSEKTLCHRIVPTLIWALVLLLLVNVGWSCWFARYGNLDGEISAMMNNGPTIAHSQSVDLRSMNNARRRLLRAQTRYWVYRSPLPRPYDEDHPQRWEVVPRKVYEEVVPGWIRRHHESCPGVIGTGQYYGEVSALIGWPTPLLWCSWRGGPRFFTITSDTGFDMPRPAGQSVPVTNGFSRALPFRPVLKGQLIQGAMCIGIVVGVQLMFWSWRGWRRCQRRRKGGCASCGYDLRGNASGVCPECGVGCRA